MSDGYQLTLSGLVRKRADLAGSIERTQADLQRMIRELEHLDATIHLFDPNYQVEAIKPKAFRPPSDWAKRGEMTRIILGILRQASEPMTTRDICHQLMTERALDLGDLSFFRLMVKRVGVALRGQRNVNRVRSTQGPGQYHLWELA